MSHALIATISEPHILGQSIGCIVALKGRNMRVGQLARKCCQFINSGVHQRISIGLVGNHGDVGKHCIAISFHFPPREKPVTGEEFERRTEAVRDWLRKEMHVTQFKVQVFPSRIEFCHCMRELLEVM